MTTQLTEPAAPAVTYRGNHKLPHQSLATGRDLHGETIAENLGKTVHGYRLSDSQLRSCVAGVPGSGMPYEYLIYSPESRAISWCAFYSREDLRVWMVAYGIRLATADEPAPGEPFELLLPVSTDRFEDLDTRPIAMQFPLPH